jgi:hypothetical protein
VVKRVSTIFGPSNFVPIRYASRKTKTPNVLLRYYENIRDQVERDAPYKFKLTSGPSTRQHADELRAEITRRRLQHAPIDWQGL